MDLAIPNWLAKGAGKEVRAQGDHFKSILFLVQKENDEFRPNRFLGKYTFKMEGLLIMRFLVRLLLGTLQEL